MKTKNLWPLLFGTIFCFSCTFQSFIPTLKTDTPNGNEPTGLQKAPPSGWLNFKGTGYSLSYPSDWYPYHEIQNTTGQSGVVYDLILSDKPGNESPQSGTEDEQARVTVWFLPKPEQNLESWVAEKWSWLNTDMHPVSLGGGNALNVTVATSTPPLFSTYYWLEIEDHFYIVEAYCQSDVSTKLNQVQAIINSLSFDEWEEK